MEIRHKIFGKNLLINLEPANSESKILRDELKIYPTFSLEERVNLRINFKKEIKAPEIESINPSIHESINNGFIIVLGSLKVYFKFIAGELSELDFSYISKEGKLLNIAKRWKNMQYASEREAIGQLFHELILVPIALLSSENSVVHSSAVETEKGDIILFGGTGGVGKTSIELELCKNHKCSFFSDDICIVNKNGNAFPNLAFPKVYAYNVKGNSKLQSEMFKRSDFLNKLHWNIHSKRGLDKVRRRVSPSIFYGNYKNQATPLKHFVVLFRDNVNKMTWEPITGIQAAKLNTIVMNSEYWILYQQIFWHEYNREANNTLPITTFSNLAEKNNKNLIAALEGKKSYLIRIPQNISHKDYKTTMVNILKNELKLI